MLTLLTLLAACDGDKAPVDTSDTVGHDGVDADGDGADATVDCDDADPLVFPGAGERCAEGDEDCDGLLGADDPDLSDGLAVYADGDGDGLGGEAVTTCTAEGYVEVGGDCDDADAALGAASTWYADADGDGAGDLASSVDECLEPDGHVANADDCDDTNPTYVPGATWYVDSDGDGHGDAGRAVVACAPTGPQVALSDDCDDRNAAVSPSATELCDGDDVDEDCDGLADDADDSVDDAGRTTWYLDLDGDGAAGETTERACDPGETPYFSATDCDDTNADVSPRAPELCDGADVDEDCDGLADDADDSVDPDGFLGWNADSDVDGFGDPAVITLACDLPAGNADNAGDCDDTDASVNPAATETWYDGVDQDCAADDDFDQDADGVTVDSDCDDTDAALLEPSFESTDGLDNDCDGFVDEASIADVSPSLWTGTSTRQHLGDNGTLLIAGDYTGDGVDDAVVTGRGTAWVLDTYGTTGDVDTLASQTLATGHHIATVLGPLGDPTDDGAIDLLLTGTTALEGEAWLLPAGTADLSAAAATFTGDVSTDRTTNAMAADINGDGTDDVVIGTPYDPDGTEEDAGNIAVYLGGAISGAYTPADAEDQIHGEDASEFLGYTMTLSDVTDDGYVDILAGAPGNNTWRSSSGAVYLLTGNASLTWADTAHSAQLFEVTGLDAFDGLGTDALDALGDLDGDGALDLSLTSEWDGEVYVWFTASSLTGVFSVSTADVTVTGVPGRFATAYTTRSDLDGDGADELVIGASGDYTRGYNSGAAWVYQIAGFAGSYDSTAATDAYFGVNVDDRCGSGLAGGGDINGDGHEDLLFGCKDYASGLGAVYTVLGR